MKENNCNHCEKKSQELQQCSGCALVFYCNQKCQKNDWKKHKKLCIPYKIVKINGKGFGVVAARVIKQGEVIIREKASLMLPLKCHNKNKASELMQQFKLLNEKEQNAILNLHGEKSSTISLDEKLQDIFECNGIEVIPVNCVALYKTIPRLNHSCCPNVVWSWVKDNYNVKEIRALTTIQTGEELCANYIDSFEGTLASKEERHRRLRKWNFICSCQICSLPSAELEENDKMREKLFLLHQLIPQHMSTWKIRKAVETAKLKLELMQSMEREMVTLLPSTMMEMYEMSAIEKIMNHCNDGVEQDLESVGKAAYELSVKLGDRFVADYQEKLLQVEQECRQILKSKK